MSTPVEHVFRPHTLVSWGGHFQYASGTAEWSNNVRMLEAESGDSFSDPAGYMATVKDDLLAWFVANTSFQSGAAHLEWLKVNNIKENGGYADDSHTNVTTWTSSNTGNATAVGPFDTCCVYTWLSDQPRGPANKGRIYPPNVPTLTSGEMNATNRTNHAEAAVNLIGVLQDGGVGGGYQATIQSKRWGTYRNIFAVRIDNLPDRQARRENGIPRSFATISI